jgi:hypothetical protein
VGEDREEKIVGVVKRDDEVGLSYISTDSVELILTLKYNDGKDTRNTTGIFVNPNANKSFRDRVNDALRDGRMKYAPGFHVSDDSDDEEGEIEIEVVK